MSRGMDQEHNISVTQNALKRVARVLAKEPEGSFLRVKVEGGGCSGFQYLFNIDQNYEPDDLILGNDEVRVVVDSFSVPLMAGSCIDFSDELIGASFKIINPNATSSCGCGVSFSL